MFITNDIVIVTTIKIIIKKHEKEKAYLTFCKHG